MVLSKQHTTQLIGVFALGVIAHKLYTSAKWKKAVMYVSPDHQQVIVYPMTKFGMTKNFAAIYFNVENPDVQPDGTYYKNSGVKI